MKIFSFKSMIQSIIYFIDQMKLFIKMNEENFNFFNVEKGRNFAEISLKILFYSFFNLNLIISLITPFISDYFFLIFKSIVKFDLEISSKFSIHLLKIDQNNNKNFNINFNDQLNNLIKNNFPYLELKLKIVRSIIDLIN